MAPADHESEQRSANLPRGTDLRPTRPGGASKRRRRRGLALKPTRVAQHRAVPAYGLLGEDALRQLEHQADWLLANVGMCFPDDAAALALFSRAGAKVDGDRVLFPHGLARALCATAPACFTLHARNPERSLQIGGESLVFMPGYGSPFVTDLDQGRRYATLADFQNFVKLTYQTPYLHHGGGTVVEPVDVAVNKRHLDMVQAHLTLSDKPFMGSVTAVDRAHDSLAMARLVFGEDFVAHHAVMQANININSPFVFDGVMSRVLRTYAEAGQCVCVSPAIFAGAMGPVTPAAVAAQTLAEVLVGLALSQLIRPGCPVVMGSFHSTMNLRTGSLIFGTPEANLVTLALAQLGRRLGVPVRSGGGQITAANTADGQAMQDSANAMWSTVLSGANQVWHAAGWLEGGLTMSYEKFILDLDNCAALLRLTQGMEVSAETLTRASYTEAGPGDNFLATAHTLATYATANTPTLLPDPGPYEAWVEAGQPNAAQRVNTVWKHLLSAYEAPPLDPQIRARLEAYVASRKAALLDEWY